MSEDWTVRVADAAGVEVGQIAPIRMEANLRYNDVGSWLVDVDADDDLVNALLNTAASIVVYPPGSSEPLFAGPWVETVAAEGDQDTLEVSGVTDAVWLARRVASPDPDGDPPWQTMERQKVGQAHQVIEAFVDENVGQGAPVVGRRQIVVDPQPLTTPEVRWTAVGQPLLELLQAVADVGQVGFRVERVDGQPTFRTFVPADRSAEVVFAANLGTVQRTAVVTRAPDITHAIVEGNEDDYGMVPTVIVDDGTLTAAWGRIERLVSHGQSDDIAEMFDAGDAALAEQQPLTVVTVDPIEGAGSIRFLHDWRLGDLVTVRVGGASIVDVVRQVTVTLEAGQAPTIQASLADIPTPSTRLLRRLARRLSLVEATRR